MELVTPHIGLLFWTTLTFVILLVLLRKFCLEANIRCSSHREDNIQKALDAAKEAEEKMSALTAQNEDLLKQAREERDIILREAKEAKESIVSEAKGLLKQKLIEF